MKISCQSCHSKYNVADDKVQGKIVKIRCRKCGSTIVVNASGGATANGSGPAVEPGAPAAHATAPTAPTGATGAQPSEWHVSVTDSDQRTMTLGELVNAYNTGVVVPETFIWTDGMDDWKALSEVDVVVNALHDAAEKPAPLAASAGYGLSAQAPAPRANPYEAAATAAPALAQPAPYGTGLVAQTRAAEPKRAAVKREPRSRDLFATRTGEDLRTAAPEVAAPVDEPLTGQRNENSVLFSLEHLTKSTEDRAMDEPAAALHEDSGIIDLKALAAKAESMRPAMPEMNVLGASAGFGPAFGAPLGGFAPIGAEAKPRSKLPLVIGAGVGIAVLLVVGIGIGLKLGGSATPAVAASASAGAFPPSSSVVVPDPAAMASAAASSSANASPSSSVAATTTAKPRPFVGGAAAGGSAWHTGPQGGGAKPGTGGGGAAGAPATGGGAPTGAGGGGAPPSPPAKKNDCNCNGDLMCMMKCSTH